MADLRHSGPQKGVKSGSESVQFWTGFPTKTANLANFEKTDVQAENEPMSGTLAHGTACRKMPDVRAGRRSRPRAPQGRSMVIGSRGAIFVTSSSKSIILEKTLSLDVIKWLTIIRPPDASQHHDR